MSAASLFVTSGDLAADRRYQWALDHAARGDFSAAVDILLQTVELAPAFATAWFALGAIRDRLGERDAAIAAFENAQKLDPDDYHGARLPLARRRGRGAGDERHLCAPAVRSIRHAVRDVAGRTPRLLRAGAAARGGGGGDVAGRSAAAL